MKKKKMQKKKAVQKKGGERTKAGMKAPAAPVRSGVCEFALAVLLVAVHFAAVMSYFEPAISNLDSNGYYKQARLIAAKGRNYEETESRAQFVGYTWRKTGENRYYSLWPSGFPAILAAVYRLFGPEAMLWVNPIMASLSLMALFLICRAWIGQWWGLAAAALTAINPSFNLHALFGYSHIAVIFFLLWSLYFLTRRREAGAPLNLFFAGLFAGVIPSIRLLDSLFGPALFLYVLLYFRRGRGSWRGPAAFAAGAALPITALCVWNQLMFGAFWKTGYSLYRYSFLSVFKWEYFQAYALPFLEKLLGEGGGFVFALGITGIAYLCARRDTWREGVLLAVLVVPMSLLYMAYFPSPSPESMRFLLPTFPLYAIGGVWLLGFLCERRSAAAAVVVGVLLFLTACWGLPQSHYTLKQLELRNKALADVAHTLSRRVPRGSVVIADELLCQHLDILGYWRLADTTVLYRKRFQVYGNAGFPQAVGAFERDVRDWAGAGGRVYLVGKEQLMRGYIGQLARGNILTRVADVSMPDTSYLRNSDMATRARYPGSTECGSKLKRGCFNFDLGAHGRMEPMYNYLLSGYPVVIYELTRKPY